MNFAAEYSTAYNLLRQGSPSADAFKKLFNSPSSFVIRGTDYKERVEAFRQRVGKFNRISAAIYAFKMVREMRRQKVLVNYLFNIKAEGETREVGKRSITLFPITVNRTVVQMVEKKDDKSS